MSPLSDIKPPPLQPEEKGRIPFISPSRALIASVDEGHGVVLDFIGDDISREVEARGFELEDLGLDEAPDGLSVWVGGFACRPTGLGDFDFFPEGEFRDLTPEEWARLSTGKSIFIDIDPAA